MTHRIHLALALALVVTQLPTQLPAQEPPKEFEVASIKPGTPGDHRVRIQIAPGGRFIAQNVTAKLLMQEAFGVRGFQISGGPSWIGSEPFEINAKAEGATTPEQLRPLLQALLAERFKLTIHRETKELPMYALVPGKSGPKLVASAEGGKPMMRMSRGSLSGQSVPMSMFAVQLGQQLGRSVTDKTGLKGAYDIKLDWTPDESQGSFPGPPGGGPDPAPAVDASGPTIFTALQEQLGLKLESQKGPVEIIVIDRIEKPTEN